MPFTFRTMQKMVAAFVIVGLILFIVTIILLGRGSDVFKFKDNYYSILNESYGFTAGNPVKYKGINIGKVKEVKLVDGEIVRVDFIIMREYRKLIRENSVMKVQPTLLGGATFVLVHSPEKGYKILEPGSRVLSCDDKEGAVILEKYEATIQKKDDLTATAKKILDNIDSLKPVINQTMYNVKDVTEELKAIVRNLKELSYEINSTNNTIGSIVKDRKALLGKVEGILFSIDVTLKNIKDISTGFQNTPSNVERTMDLLQQNLIELKKVLIGVKNILGGEKEKPEKFVPEER